MGHIYIYMVVGKVKDTIEKLCYKIELYEFTIICIMFLSLLGFDSMAVLYENRYVMFWKRF